MIELRWKTQGRPESRKKLQFRSIGGRFLDDWQDVPTVIVPREPDEPMDCCDGGPQWGHAWSCVNAEGGPA